MRNNLIYLVLIYFHYFFNIKELRVYLKSLKENKIIHKEFLIRIIIHCNIKDVKL